jgi:hypothetical protein
MLAESKNVVGGGPLSESDDPDENTNSIHMVVYEGFLTQLITGKLALSVPYYTSVTKALKGMGCIRQLRRGGSTSPSQWEMIYEPDLERFLSYAESNLKKPPRQDHKTQTTDQITALNRRVQDLEDWRDAVNDFLTKRFGTEEGADDD